jgi:hypothetical protein
MYRTSQPVCEGESQFIEKFLFKKFAYRNWQKMLTIILCHERDEMAFIS